MFIGCVYNTPPWPTASQLQFRQINRLKKRRGDLVAPRLPPPLSKRRWGVRDKATRLKKMAADIKAVVAVNQP